MAETVQRLVSHIEHRELVLPEFQREFTWDRDQAKLLLDSLMKDYPTGSLLLWKTGNPPALKNMPEFEPGSRVDVLLDGQQRLTVLYLFLKNEVPPYYSSIESKRDPRNLYYNLETLELKYYKKLEMDNDSRWVKVTNCFDDEREPKVKAITQELFDGDEWADYYDVWDDNLRRLKDIQKENFPIMYVEEGSTLGEALTVFDRVNSQGTPLSDAEIALAHMVSSWQDTRREFKTKLDELKQQGFDFDLTFLTRCMNAVINHRAEFDQLHSLDEETLKNGWKETKRILDYLINVLRGNAYVYSSDDLNTPNVLIPLVAYLARNGGEFGSASNRDQLLYWMYAALLTRRYTGSINSTLRMDLNSLKEPRPIDALLTTLKEEEGEPEVTPSNLDMRSVRHPIYNMMVTVIRSRGGQDWKNGIDLSEPFGKQYSTEKHHIFPRSRLSEAGYDTGNNHRHKKVVNEIANRVPLTKSGNIGIFNDYPREYLPKVEKKFPGTLEAFLIPRDPNLWKLENYEEFLKVRRELIAEAINSFLKLLRT